MIIYLQFRKNTIPRTTIVSEHLKFLKNSSQETVRVRWALGLLLPFVTTCAPGVSTWWRRWLPIRDAPKLGPNPWLHKVLPLLCPPKPRFRDQHMAFTVWYITVFQKFPHHMENLDPQETNLAFSWGIWSHNRLATNQWEIMNVTQVFITYFCLHQKICYFFDFFCRHPGLRKVRPPSYHLRGCPSTATPWTTSTPAWWECAWCDCSGVFEVFWWSLAPQITNVIM